MVISPPFSNKFTALLNVSDDSLDSDDSFVDKEFVDATQVIENSLDPNLNNRNFL